MFKLKVYGAFIALIYSFFFHTLNHRKDYSVRKGISIESQIRSGERREQKGTSISLHSSKSIDSIAGRDATPLDPREFNHQAKPAFTILSHRTDRSPYILYRSVATESFRVLRI